MGGLNVTGLLSGTENISRWARPCLREDIKTQEIEQQGGFLLGFGSWQPKADFANGSSEWLTRLAINV